MADFMPFDLGQAYAQAEGVLRSRTLREEAQKRTQIDAQQMELEQRKAAEQQEMMMLLPLVKAGRPEAIERVVGRIAERNPQVAEFYAQNPGELVGMIEQGLGIKPETPKQTTLYPTAEGYLPADQASGKMPYRAPAAPAAPTKEPQTNWQRRTRTLPDGSVVEYDFNPRTREEVPVTGSAPGKPTSRRPIKAETEKDKTVSVLFGSLIGAENDIAKMSGGTTTASRLNAALPAIPLVGGAAGTLQSDAFRKYESAALRWAANLLYIKSGATAPPEEVRSTYKQFFPQPGDGPESIAQKEAARRQEMSNIMKTYPFLADRYTLPDAKPPPGAQSTQSPKTFTHPSGATVEILD